MAPGGRPGPGRGRRCRRPWPEGGEEAVVALAAAGGLAGADAARHAERVRARGGRGGGGPRALPRGARARRGGGRGARRRCAAAVRDLVAQGPRGPRRHAAGRGRAPARRSSRGLLGAIEAAAARRRGAAAEDIAGGRQEALLERARALVGELGLEDGRLYQEVVRAVERHDVAEEVQRLRSHAASARELLVGDGRARGQAPRLPGPGADARGQHHRAARSPTRPRSARWWSSRAEIERLREQVQNVE